MLISCLIDIVLILYGEIISWSLMGPRVKGFFLKYNINDLLWTDTVCMGEGGVLPFFFHGRGSGGKVA